MKRYYLFILCAIIMFALIHACSTARKTEVKTPAAVTPIEVAEVPPVVVGGIPASLDSLYPPLSERPIWLMSMMGMAMPFTGIMVDLFEEDFENAAANYEAFKQNYTNVSKLVPEWTEKFPMGPVEDLGVAVQSGNPEAVMPAMEKMGLVCHECHLANMIPVQLKHSWDDFREVTVSDPVTAQEVPFPQLMKFLDLNFTGVYVDVQQGQMENAQEHYQGLVARFGALKESCDACHETDRKYFVDDEVMGMVEKLGQIISADPVDPAALEKIGMAIGMESCRKCHLVHGPAAMSKY